MESLNPTNAFIWLGNEMTDMSDIRDLSVKLHDEYGAENGVQFHLLLLGLSDVLSICCSTSKLYKLNVLLRCFFSTWQILSFPQCIIMIEKMV